MKKFTNSFLAFLFFLAASSSSTAQTNVSGGIYNNTTWTKANSPYIVTDTVVVFPGVTLTIEPGVTVEFADNKYLEIRQATFIAQGTNTDSITFTSNSGTPHMGSWNKLWINSPSAMTIDYCIFKYANTALNVNGYQGLIKNSYFYMNNTSVAPNSATHVTIHDCSFYNNNKCFPVVYNPLTIMHSTFYNNNMCIGSIGGGINECHLDGCTFMNNQNGVEISGIGTVLNCIFNNCGYALVHDLDAGNFTVGYCTFCNNTFGFNNSPHAPNDTLYNCNFSYNHVAWAAAASCTGSIFADNDTAIYLGGKIFLNNYIYHNQVGVVGLIDLYNNHLCNNTLYNIIWRSSSNVNLPNVCWCDTDSATIRSKIYDGYVNIAYGLVNFSPYLNCDSTAFAALPPINCQTVILTDLENHMPAIRSEIEVFPNPTSDFITIILSKNNYSSKLKIFNMLGELKYYSSAISPKQATIDVSPFANGIYLLEAATDEGIIRQKFIKQDGNR